MGEIVEMDIDRDMDLLEELLQMYSGTKDKGVDSWEGEGPFSWKQPFKKHGVRVLFLSRCSRPSKHRRRCKIFEHTYWLPKIRALPWSSHVMTLHMTRVGDQQTHLRIECEKQRVKDTIFAHFVAEMFKLRDRYARPTWGAAQIPQARVGNEELQQEFDAMPTEVPDNRGEETEVEPTRPDWFPKTPGKVSDWKEAFAIIGKVRQEYRVRYENLDAEDPEPSVDDLRDAIAYEMHKKRPSAKWVRNVIKAGENGWLD